jgi:stage II sporulation SpoAA-like protein
MPASIQHESGNLFRIHVSGVLRQGELLGVQTVAVQGITRLGTIKLLFVLDGFEGWERGADWGDLAFYAAHDTDIEKIAIVGDEKWRDHGLAFAGAGIRKAAVRFFPTAESTQARAWLLQGDRDPSPSE